MVFKSGEEWNGNKDGRPKGSVSIVTAIKKKLEEEHPDSTPEEKKLWLDMVVQKIFAKGLEGDVSMLKDMINRVDGMPKESVDLTSKGEKIGGFNFIRPNEDDNTDNQAST